MIIIVGKNFLKWVKNCQVKKKRVLNYGYVSEKFLNCVGIVEKQLGDDDIGKCFVEFKKKVNAGEGEVKIVDYEELMELIEGFVRCFIVMANGKMGKRKRINEKDIMYGDEMRIKRINILKMKVYLYV